MAVSTSRSKYARKYFKGNVVGNGSKEDGLVIEGVSPEGTIRVELSTDRAGSVVYRVVVGPTDGQGPGERPLVGGRFRDA